MLVPLDYNGVTPGGADGQDGRSAHPAARYPPRRRAYKFTSKLGVSGFGGYVIL